MLLRRDRGDLGEVRETLRRERFRYLVNQLPVHERIDVLRELLQQEPIAEVEHPYDTLGLRSSKHASRASQEVHPRPGLRENYDPAKGTNQSTIAVFAPFKDPGFSPRFSLAFDAVRSETM